MRKFLLASVATLGTGGLVGTAMAQVPAVVGTPVVGAPTQGQRPTRRPESRMRS